MLTVRTLDTTGFSGSDMVHLEQLNLQQTEVDAAQSGTKLHGTGNSMGLDHVFLCRPSHLSLPGYIKLVKIHTKTQATKINNPITVRTWSISPNAHGRFETNCPPCGPCHLFQNLSLYLCLPIFHLWTFQRRNGYELMAKTGPFFSAEILTGSGRVGNPGKLF